MMTDGVTNERQRTPVKFLYRATACLALLGAFALPAAGEPGDGREPDAAVDLVSPRQ